MDKRTGGLNIYILEHLSKDLRLDCKGMGWYRTLRSGSLGGDGMERWWP